MDLRYIVLSLLANEDNKSIQGKTLLQKKIYFIGILVNEDFGYKPHYYGPFSAKVDEALDDLIAARLVREHIEKFTAIDEYGFGMRRYNYTITDDGEMVFNEEIVNKLPQYESIKKTVEQIESAGKLEYFDLSIAAKAYYILRKENRPKTNSQIINEARSLGWNIEESHLKKAVSFLGKLGLVTSENN